MPDVVNSAVLAQTAAREGTVASRAAQVTNVAASTHDNTWGAALIADALVVAGVRHVVIAPGSRSTPLVAAFARHADVRTHVVHDERSGAFLALGIVRATGAPAALLVTSGTALANATPAVVESDCDRVPLVVVSADRPTEAQGTDANQTIDQQRFFGGRARAFENIAPPEDIDDADGTWARVTALVDAARGPCPGPVHLNAMFRKPLEPRAGVHVARPAHTTLAPRERAPHALDGEVLDVLKRASSGLVVLGAALDARERSAMERVAHAMPWPVVVEGLSGLRAASFASGRVAHALLLKAGIEMPPADVVVWLGGALVSPELLDVVAAARVVVRVEDRRRRRPERARALLHIDASPDVLLPHVNALPRVDDARGRAKDGLACAVLERELDDDEAPLKEPFIAMCTAAAAHARGALLFVGNSMPVRDVELFAGARAPVVVANRGASGIDGLLSTAAGLALGSGKPVCALIGDVSFLHDAGALSALAQHAPLLRVVVVVNGGGGIFDFLPIRAHDDLLRPYFTTPHTVDIAALARAYGVKARVIDDRASLSALLAEPIDDFEIVVVNVRGRDNVADHRAIYRAVVDACAPVAHGEGV
jgi:2-succinyl-5-enolpyruvyl-6-hydroxy-3-cyclohexene-1-carboxylate synthase